MQSFADFKYWFREWRVFSDADFGYSNSKRAECPECGARRQQLIVSVNRYELQQYAHCERCKYTAKVQQFIVSKHAKRARQRQPLHRVYR
jgi:uncharacterized paraquat-inducible protein A